MKYLVKMILPVAVLGFVLMGCGGGAVSETKPISAVLAEAKSMSADQLKAIVNKYQTVIDSKKTEIAKLTEKLKQIPITQMLGDEAKKIKSDVQEVSNSVKALADRLNIYAQQLQSKA